MKFILTNFTTGEKQAVTRECVDRVKGKNYVDSLVKKVKEAREPIGIYFEGDYDLYIVSE